MYKISIIIPCYNVENYLEECLDSVVGQSIGLEHLQIILVDDCSSDGTVEILRKYEKNYSENVMLILCEKNGRQGAARNIGLQYATGEYILFVDSDDIIHKDMCEILYDIATKTNSDIVQFRDTLKYDDMFSNTDNSCKIYDVKTEEDRKKFTMDDSVLNMSCRTKLYDRNILEISGVSFPEGVCYEEPLFTYPLKYYVNRVSVIERPLYFYRTNPNGTILSTMNKPEAILDHLKVNMAVYDFMKQRGFCELYQSEIDCYFLHTFYAEPFYFHKKRGERLPVSVVRFMSKVVKMYVPFYMSNKYLPDEEKPILSLIEKADLGDEQLEVEIENVIKGLQ
jgi:glycosyltransferase involved in cell wall biosynthesis